MRNETLIFPVGPAASSSACETVSPTSRLSSPDSGDWARQRRTKSRISGIEDGLAGNVWDTTTTGTTSMLSLIVLSDLFIDLPVSRLPPLASLFTGYGGAAPNASLPSRGAPDRNVRKGDGYVLLRRHNRLMLAPLGDG